ncbi:hypothetical protein GALL_410740 [mine drainage metagenome]|uniref:Uncharacterized protein n=1 Tax=mine drainage metagenome TaxID=410659 RepID=A0A1J5Q1T1_9ZZZZ
MRRIHIGLDLEHHAGEGGFCRIDNPRGRRTRQRRWRQIDQRVEHLAHAEVVDRRAEKQRRLPPGQKLGLVEGRRSFAQQRDFALRLFVRLTEALHRLRIVQTGEQFFVFAQTLFARTEHPHLIEAQVVHAVKITPHADRPGERHHRHAQVALDLVHQIERLPHLAVHLVDEGENGRVARAADLQQAQGLLLHAVCRIDDHQRRVHCGEHAVGILGKVLVARSVEQVDHAVTPLHLHDRGRH